MTDSLRRRLAPFFLNVLYKVETLTQLASYSNFNTATFEGRVFDASIANGPYGEFLGVTIITSLVDGTETVADEGITITFNDSSQLLNLHKKGWFSKGRRVHVTGAISKVSEVYEKDGVVQLRKRPQLSLDSSTAQLTLGAIPKQDAPKRAAAGTVVVKRVSEDATPELKKPDEAPVF